MAAEDIIHIEIEAATLADLRSFIDEIQPDIGCRAVPRRTGDTFVMDAYVPETQLQAVRDARASSLVSLRILENATEVGRERQKEVGEGNRFAARGETPRGLGRKE
jgi:hypothetical protein